MNQLLSQAEQMAQPAQHDADELALIQLIEFMNSPVQEEVEVAVFTLSEMVSTAFDEDGARLGQLMREHNGLTQLLLQHGQHGPGQHVSAAARWVRNQQRNRLIGKALGMRHSGRT
jgi:hypothetical protein